MVSCGALGVPLVSYPLRSHYLHCWTYLIAHLYFKNFQKNILHQPFVWFVMDTIYYSCSTIVNLVFSLDSELRGDTNALVENVACYQKMLVFSFRVLHVSAIHQTAGSQC